jgi:hypothetical protein
MPFEDAKHANAVSDEFLAGRKRFTTSRRISSPILVVGGFFLGDFPDIYLNTR